MILTIRHSGHPYAVAITETATGYDWTVVGHSGTAATEEEALAAARDFIQCAEDDTLPEDEADTEEFEMPLVLAAEGWR